MSELGLLSFREQLNRLIHAFGRDRSRIALGGFSEADLRIQYLDPFFTALGWDVGNRALKPFYDREVVVEPPQRIQGRSRRPDYVFRVGGIDKFLCEAKRPFEHATQRHFYQVQNYVYHMKLWIGVLSDFDSFTVFLVGSQPSKDNPFPPVEGWQFGFQQYGDQADRIWEFFSRDNVAQGSLDRLAQSTAKIYRAGKQGWLIRPERNKQIDEQFLRFLEDQRASLARTLHRSSGRALSGDELTEAVQKILDRLLFQRISEDRNIDVGRTLGSVLADWERTGRIRGALWSAIVSNFGHMRRTFNGGLYGKPGDEPHFVERLRFDESWLAGFLDEIAGEDSRYLFSIIPVAILGNVYERFLGSVATATGRIEQKPEVRKAGGVYYTPEIVVKQIVEETVGRLIEGRSPDQLRTFRVLDPACGSGSFLIAAFERLCRHHLSWFAANPNQQEGDACYQSQPGDLRLTTGYKRKILLRSIFGVDVDPQAVEVTQMSLYLKVLEDETTESLNADHRLFPRETYLPDLDKNIKCGNSLIEPRLALDLQDGTLDPVAVHAFDWRREFPKIVPSGGFDVVIGNPPYYSIEKTWGKGDPRIEYLKANYSDVYQDRSDILFYFLKRGCSLAKTDCCFIVSRAFLEAHKARNLRSWLGKKAPPRTIIDFANKRIFEGVGIATAIVALQKGSREQDCEIYRSRRTALDPRPLSAQLSDSREYYHLTTSERSFGGNPWVFTTPSEQALIERIDNGRVPAGRLLLIGQGMQTGRNDIFGGLTVSIAKEWKLQKGAWYRRARNSQIQRWHIEPTDEILLFPNAFDQLKDVPTEMRRYLESYRRELRERAACLRGDCLWWQYTWPLPFERYGENRILSPYLAGRNRFALDQRREFLGLTDTIVLFQSCGLHDIRYYLALLNSNVLTWRFRFIGKLKGGGIREYFPNSVARIPIHVIDRSVGTQVSIHNELVDCASRLIQLRSDYDGSTAKRAAKQASIDALELKVDELVCQLYGISDTDYQRICEDLNGAVEEEAEADETSSAEAGGLAETGS